MAYDPLRERLFVAREKAPVGIIEVNGFFNDRGEALDLSVGGDPQRDRGLFLTDLSSLYYDKASDHLLVLSDESRVVIELDRAGDPLGSLTLRGGNHGLTDGVPRMKGWRWTTGAACTWSASRTCSTASAERCQRPTRVGERTAEFRLARRIAPARSRSSVAAAGR